MMETYIEERQKQFLFVLHKNEEKTEQNSASFRKPTSIERGLRPNGYFPLMRQPHEAAPESPTIKGVFRGQMLTAYPRYFRI